MSVYRLDPRFVVVLKDKNSDVSLIIKKVNIAVPNINFSVTRNYTQQIVKKIRKVE